MTAPKAKSAAPAEALVERFREALARLWPEGGKLGLAVSGGPDSLAMLLLAEAAIPGRFEVATVDHGLRPENAKECAWVVAICQQRAIACEVLTFQMQGGNLQAAARQGRYLVLADWGERRGLSAIATAHHADDQTETLLMRLNRGSGVAGLAGVRETAYIPTFEIEVVRPLLWFRRTELADVVAVSGLTPVEDPSNADERFERARIRKALAGNDWLDPLAITASAAHLADANEAIEHAATRAWGERVSLSVSEDEYRYRPPLSRAIELRVVERMICGLGGTPRGGDVARLIDELRAERSGNIAGVLATVAGDDWVFRREPPRRTG